MFEFFFLKINCLVFWYIEKYKVGRLNSIIKLFNKFNLTNKMWRVEKMGIPL